jgi:hypothetical protein
MSMLRLISAIALIVPAFALADEPWKPVPGHLMTRWAADVSPDKAWPEYPRPQMVREKWMNLNGLWGYTVTGSDAAQPAAKGTILVPFPIESALSGVGRPLEPTQTLEYQRTFHIPDDWKGQRVLLHIGACDWATTVRLNGAAVGEHKGGYDPFTFDLTAALKPGDNQLSVSVTDPTDTGGQPRGKQWLTPHSIWYTRTSGIWQTVWLEPVPTQGITGYRVETSSSGAVRIAVESSANDPQWPITAEVLAGGHSIAHAAGTLAAPITLNITNPHVWSPDDPFLYDVRISLGSPVADQVSGYFALRDIAVAPDARGTNRLMLNGKPLFQYGPLDQGFWPDGIYTPPTDEAMKFDIQAVKKMGGNMLRKHVKVEPDRFYYWCDKLGVMVWQDMPSPFFAAEGWREKLPPLSDEWKTNFERELRALIDTHRNHPSIVMWVPFNEGWGQNDLAWAKSMVGKVKEWDPTRLVNCASGWTDTGVGDVHDVHDYPGPGMAPVESKRASVLGEFGGLGLPLPGHTWVEKNNWGYVSFKDQKELTDAYTGLIDRLPILIAQGLCAAVYTQTTDCEIECNGWLTYDRAVWKIDPDRAAAATARCFGPLPHLTTVVLTAAQSPQTWRYTTTAPPEAWFKPDFDDASWGSGASSFGTRGTPGAAVGTVWDTADIWLRRTIDLDPAALSDPHLWIHHDEDAEVYLNGVLAARLKAYTTSYVPERLSAEARAALHKGRNVIAVHCHQTTGGQNIDVGLVDLGWDKP